MSRHLPAVGAAVLLFACVFACDRAHEERTPGPAPGAVPLPELPNPLPDGAGRSECAAVCTVCHSARYVTDQPHLTREAWVKIVDKMKTAYGAPVPENLAPAILDYLVAVRGPEPTP